MLARAAFLLVLLVLCVTAAGAPKKKAASQAATLHATPTPTLEPVAPEPAAPSITAKPTASSDVDCLQHCEGLMPNPDWVNLQCEPFRHLMYVKACAVLHPLVAALPFSPLE